MIVRGQRINDRYEIIKSIGEGGMANVYLAHDIILDRDVAVKVLRGDLAGDEKFVRRFQREALSASNLNHPNIVEVYDVGEEDGKYYIVMEYVEGKTLKQLIQKRGSLTLVEVIDIMSQLTSGLAHAHDAYIIHRDIKPQNILILDNGLVKITDFGIAMALNASGLTQTNSVMGSVHYLPPEQASGKGSTIKSDIYSLGILMYELLTGKIPFKGENAVEIALKQMKEALPSVRKINPLVPQSIENIIIKATAKNPKNRYNDAREMHNDLKTALDDNRLNEPVHTYRYPENDLDDTKVMKPITRDNKLDDSVVVKPISSADEDSKFKKMALILGSIFGGLVIIAILGFLLIPILTRVPDIKIPDVSKLSVSEAANKLKKAGFEVALKTIKQSSDTIASGLIIKTDPAIGRLIKKGTTITMYESSGIETIIIENYIGKKISDIKALLTLKGLNVLTEVKDVDDATKYQDQKDIIIDQNPKEGSKLDKGSTITLYTPNIVTTYPDMVLEKWNIDDVKAFAEKYDIPLTVTEVETDQYTPGTILTQSRKAGSNVVSGVSLKVSIAKKPADILNATDKPE